MSENTSPAAGSTEADVEAHKFAQNFETTSPEGDVEAHKFAQNFDTATDEGDVEAHLRSM